MRHRLSTAPWWLLSLIVGVLFGVVCGVAVALLLPPPYGGDATESVVIGLIGGVLFGLPMGPILARTNQRAREAIGALPAERLGEVSRAASRGPVPADPEIRAAATRLVRFQLAEALRYRTPMMILFGGFLVLQVLFAVTLAPWHWAVAVLVAVPLAVQVWQPRRLRRRAELLTGEPVEA